MLQVVADAVKVAVNELVALSVTAAGLATEVPLLVQANVPVSVVMLVCNCAKLTVVPAQTAVTVGVAKVGSAFTVKVTTRAVLLQPVAVLV